MLEQTDSGRAVKLKAPPHNPTRDINIFHGFWDTPCMSHLIDLNTYFKAPNCFTVSEARLPVTRSGTGQMTQEDKAPQNWKQTRVCRNWGSHSSGYDKFYLLPASCLAYLSTWMILRKDSWLPKYYMATYPRRQNPSLTRVIKLCISFSAYITQVARTN
jgi:hypothetical protein